MLDILHGLCESNSLVMHEVEIDIEGVNSKIGVPSKENVNQEYYLILECEAADDALIKKLINEYAEKFMDVLEKLDCTDESFRKNSTLILCCEAGHITEKLLLNFEENPYFFKKNVITYSKSELVSLKEKLNNQFSNEHLNKLLMSDEGGLFDSFKTQKLEDGNYYPLLIRVITKLPFVHYLPQPNQLDDLSSFVRSELDQSDLELLDFICDGDENFSSDLIDAKVTSAWGEV
ncbi:hypothetical protein MED121_03020 [Marinomonas sp. MED121]|uniref:ABC-three component system middle component 1 n=1 Tax=Marinomonas sp. MED121 TaxID=314277 RepID=UPI0000690BC5|nr:ABC-three component system middle component 1 [Marinomonas sp. MED121]EAQ66149.1 hypothetical protein MED121_03020 [Marinomonas sp. MED121]